MSINLPLKVDNLFCTPVYSLLMPTFLNEVNKISDRYIEEAKNNNQKTREGIEQSQKIRKIYRIDKIENFADVYVKNISTKKPRLIYCSDKDLFYVLANKINVKNYDFDFENKVPYDDWNYVGQYKKNYNSVENDLRDYLDENKLKSIKC